MASAKRFPPRASRAKSGEDAGEPAAFVEQLAGIRCRQRAALRQVEMNAQIKSRELVAQLGTRGR